MQYGLIGEHLGHSFSKMIHEKFGYYHYDLKEISKDHIVEYFKEHPFKGINVTIPYKEIAFKACDHLDEQAKSIQACNCIVNKDGKLYGHNTDYDGIVETFKHFDIDLKDKKVLILGKGGASKAFEAVCKDHQAAIVQIVYYKPYPGCITYEDVQRSYLDADILINATPVGMAMHSNASPIDLSPFTNLEFVFDAIYNPLNTKLIQQAKRLNIRCTNGLLMLVAQAKYAAEYFLNQKIDMDLDSLVDTIILQTCNLVFIGMPSCGKSTISRQLANNLHKEWIDLDEEIEKEAGMKIAEIFERYGEDRFRNFETQVTFKNCIKNNVVIACGGGIILREENIEALSQNGIIIYLDRPLDNLIRHDPSRPKLKEGIHTLYKERKDLYEKACDIKIKNDKTIQKTMQICIESLKNKNLYKKFK